MVLIACECGTRKHLSIFLAWMQEQVRTYVDMPAIHMWCKCRVVVISGGKFPRGLKRRGQPCACVRRTYLAGG